MKAAESQIDASPPTRDPYISTKATRVWLVIILMVAALIRTVGLGRVPPPLFRDEAEKGYNAWCLAETARDYEGRRLPLFINAFGSYTSAIYQYATAPIVAFLGLEPWTTRLAAALVGTATVAVLFLLARGLFDPVTALVAAALLAVSPWHVCFSRWAQQGIFMPFFFTVAAWGVVRFRQGRGPAALPLAAAAIGLSAYAYAVGRVLAPLFLLLLVIVARRELMKHKAWTAVSAVVLAFTVAPTIWFTTHQSEEALARFRRVSIAQPGMTPPQVVGRFLVNYARHFDPAYLVVRGDRELRHSPRRVGQLHGIELPFLLLGLYFLFRRRDRTAAAIVLGWLLIGPVAASMTNEGVPHALRSLAGVPAFALAAAFGAVQTVRRVPKKSTRISISALLICAELAFVGHFLYRYCLVYPRESAKAWQFGVGRTLSTAQQMLDSQRKLGNLDSQAWVSESIGGIILPPQIICPAEIFIAFYEKIPPRTFQESRLSRTPFRVIRWDTDLRRALTQPNRPPICLIALPGEVPTKLAEQMRMESSATGSDYRCFRVPAMSQTNGNEAARRPVLSAPRQERR